MNRRTKGIVMAVTVLGAAQFAAAHMLIDDFSAVAGDAPWPIELTTVGTVIVDEAFLGASTIGSVRSTKIEATYLDLDGIDDVSVTVAAGAGILDFASTAGAVGNLELFYDGGDGDLDVSLQGESSIMIDFSLFDYPDAAAMPTTVTLSDGSNIAELTINLNAAGAQTVAFDFANFSNIENIDMTSINSIGFAFEGSLATDFRISNIYTVPAPGAMALLGLAGLAGTRRRRA